jgi:hypothetical protein
VISDVYNVPVKYRATYERALAGRSAKAAIKAHCLMCCYWQIREVQRCTDPACPLFALRKRYFKRESGPEESKTGSSTPETGFRAPGVDYRGLTACGQTTEAAQ